MFYCVSVKKLMLKSKYILALIVKDFFITDIVFVEKSFTFILKIFFRN